MISAGEMRGLAAALQSRYPGSDKALAHASLLNAEADMIDAKAGTISDACDYLIHQDAPILGRISIRNGARENIERPYQAEAEAIGIYLAFEWCDGPVATDQCGMLIRIFIGHRDTGIQAQYEASTKQWYACKSRGGNYGKNYSHGGTWSSVKINQPPAIVGKLEVFMSTIEQAKANLKAAKLRVKAAHQREHAASYLRQSEHPAYPGQEAICMGKAGTVEALAAQTEAEADLILAQAGS